LLEPSAARFKLLILAGGDSAPLRPQIQRLGLEGRVIIRERVTEVEEPMLAADLSLYASETESFCLAILEGMAFGRPAVAFAVGGIPEVVETGRSGELVPNGDVGALGRALAGLIANPARRAALGANAQTRARAHFSPEKIVPEYERIYGF
jgi:glycosyltransferase involved in cell wall biosynthesis